MSCTGSTQSTGTFNCDLVAVCWHVWACERVCAGASTYVYLHAYWCVCGRICA